MLLREKCRGREHYDLSAVHDGFEHRPESDFCLAESDVAAKEPVHRFLGFHVCLYLLHGTELVISLNVRKSVFEELLLLIVRSACEALVYASCSVYLKKVVSNFLDGFPGARNGLLPLVTAKP